MKTTDAYEILSQNSGIQKGDIVKVLRVAGHHEMGWGNCWVSEMTEMVGGEFEVVKNDDGTGFGLREGKKKNFWEFPFFVLQFVRRPVQPVKVKLNADYTAEVSPDGVKIGCQSWTRKEFADILSNLRIAMTKTVG